MSSNALKGPFLRVVTTRTYSAQAAANPAPVAAAAKEVKKTVLPNKLTVASLDDGSPISRVSIVIRAGSRYETPENLGITHLLRIAAGLGTKKYSYFGITRRLQQTGASLNVTSDREILSYTIENTSDVLEENLDILGNVVAHQAFKPWEIDEITPRLKYDLVIVPPSVRAVDLLHKAAFRSGLGNSLFCPDYNVGKISPETLQHYVQSHFTTSSAAVVGVGVDHERLLAYAQNLSLDGKGDAQSAAQYKGGEIRLDTGAPVTTVAVGVEGASLKNAKEALAFGALQYALGVGPSIKWGSQGATPLGKAIGNIEPAAVTAFNASYSDAGLFGFVASSPPDSIGKVVEAAVKQLRQGSLSDADVARGKAQLKANVLMDLESSGELLSEIGSQVLLTGDVHNATSIVSAIDSLQSGDVNAAAKKVASGKLSIGAVGSLGNAPYVDDLK